MDFMNTNDDRRQPGRGWFYLLLGLAIFTLLSVGIFLALTALVRRTAQEALNPITQTNKAIETRMAELLNPTPTILPNPITIIHDVRSLARLETIQYTLEKVITAETGQNELRFLFGDRLLFVAHGVVIAGVDLSRMRPQDMWVEGDVLFVRMPAAEVFVATLDNEKSYVYDRDTGLLSKGDTNLETNARVVAEQEILKAALEDGILVQAQQNAESYMSRMLLGLGFADVIFVESNTATPTP
jgi:hypothetical protein